MGDKRFLDLLEELKSLHIKKAADYGRGEDPLANLRASAEFGFPAWVGVAIRLGDKLQRVKSFVKNGKLENESIEDSFMDIACYGILGLILYRETIIPYQPELDPR